MSSTRRLAFVSTSVLKSEDGGHTFDKEIEVEKKVVLQGGGDGTTTLLEREKAILEKRQRGAASGGSLYEQLKTNREAEEEEWKRKNPTHIAPKALDEEDVAFLREMEEKKVREQRLRDEQEAEEIAAFAAARAGATVSVQNNALADERTSNAFANSNGKRDLPEDDADGMPLLVRKKRKKKKKKKKKKNARETETGGAVAIAVAAPLPALAIVASYRDQ